MRSVLHDVYEKLPVRKWSCFFTRDEQNWSNYLQRQDAFKPHSYAELQAQQRIILNDLLKEVRVEMQETVNKVLKLITGLAVAIGALCAWHFCHIDGWLAAMVGLGGLALVGHAVGYDFDF